MSLADYDRLAHSLECWFCVKCLCDTLPFYSADLHDFPFQNPHFSISSKFETWMYKPFLVNNMLSEASDVILSDNACCAYYTATEFDDYVKNNNLSNNLSCFHLNYCSLLANQNNVEALLSSLSVHFTFITFSETWLNESNAALFAHFCPGYTLYQMSRANSQGGGVAAFIDNNYEVSAINTTARQSFEHLQLRVTSNNTDIILCVIYRPPNTSLNTFINDFTFYVD
jgi:hypothetical protein